MKRLSGSTLCLIVGTLLCLYVSGCGSAHLVKPKGKVLTNGEPLRPSSADMLQVTFHSQEGTPENYPAAVDGKTGTFEVVGLDRKGIPPGKYRVSVQMLGGMSGIDRLKGKFGPDNSSFMHDVTSSGQVIELDVGIVDFRKPK